MRHVHQKHAREFEKAVLGGDFQQTDGGIIVRRAAFLQGVYIEGIKGHPESFRRHKNLIPDEGVLHILAVVFHSTAKAAAWYLAPFSGSTTPAANLTAANFASTQSEITSLTEGFSEVTRQQFVPAAPAAGKVTNIASKAQFTIVSAGTVNIWGAALLSASARGATSGVLASCSKYGVVRTVANTDVWQCGYEVSLTDS
jgi:hypothetical protein